MRCKITSHYSVKEKEKNACFTADTAIKIYHSSIPPPPPLKRMIRMIRQPNHERVDELSNAGKVYLTKPEFTRTFCICFPCLESCSFFINTNKKIKSLFFFLMQINCYSLAHGINKDRYYTEIKTHLM